VRSGKGLASSFGAVQKALDVTNLSYMTRWTVLFNLA
jgi:hypothetical protein